MEYLTFARFLGAGMALPDAPPAAQLATAPPVVWVLALLGGVMTSQRAGPLGVVGYLLATVGVLLTLNSPVAMVGMLVIGAGLLRTQVRRFDREQAAETTVTYQNPYTNECVTDVACRRAGAREHRACQR